MSKLKYKLVQDLLIPAGTEVGSEPPHKAQRYTETAVVTIAVTDDITAEWRMDMEEALDAGVVVPVVPDVG
jgi:hypothetical protein